MKKKKIDFFEIKEALEDQPSENLILIINQCVVLMRRKCVEETVRMIGLIEKKRNPHT